MESKMDASALLNTLGVPTEVVSQIAEKLRLAREAHHQTIEAVAKELKLNVQVLESIENCHWDQLPPGAPGRSIIRLYARHLGTQLPEFDKFLEMKNTSEISSSYTNLEKIVECARNKHLEHMNGVQKLLYQGLNSFKKNKPRKVIEKKEYSNVVKAKKELEISPLEEKPNEPFVSAVSNMESNVAASLPPALPIANDRKKTHLLPISLGVIGIGIIAIAFMLSRRESDEFEQVENSIVFDNSSVNPETAVQSTSSFVEETNTENNASSSGESSHVVEESPADVVVKTPDVVPQTPAVAVQAPAVAAVQAPAVAAVQAPVAATQAIEQKIPTPSHLSMQKMKIDILSPVAIKIDTDEQSVFDGMAQPGVMTFEFRKDAKLRIQDSSKVKLSYAGWEGEQLSTYARKRVIVLRANRFAD
jgi:cytoskeletal protein RodZ